MASTLDEVLRLERMTVERAEVVMSKTKCAEYALHPDITYFALF
jgi:hypothetical protein